MKPIIDVSKHNGKIEWDRVKLQIEGAILRIGYRGYNKTGSLHKDPTFLENDKMCEAYGIPREFYFFPTDITEHECIETSIWILNLLKKYGYMPITLWLDSEFSNDSRTGRSDRLTKDTRTQMLLSVRQKIHAICPEWKIGIYASQSWFYGHLNLGILYQKKVPLWVARWGDIEPDIIYSTWQYSNKGVIEGINGRVDLSIRRYPDYIAL